MSKTAEEIAIVQEWINEKGLVASFDGEIMVPIGKTIQAQDIINLMQAHTAQALDEIKKKVEHRKEIKVDKNNIAGSHVKAMKRDELDFVLQLIEEAKT